MYTDEFQCLDCTEDRYSFTAMTLPGQCPPCPQYGICLDGELYPEPGYVRFTEDSEVFVRCFNKKACEAGNLEDPLQNCEDSYDGVLCASCADNHWKPYGTFYCYKCISDGLQTIKLYACPIFYFLLVAGLTRVFLSKIGQKNTQWIAIVRLFINMYQILQILQIQADDLASVPPNIYLKTYIDYKVNAFLPMNWLVDFQCLEHHLGFDSITMFYATLYVYMLAPLIILVINFIVWFFYAQIKSCIEPEVGGHRFQCKRTINRVAMTGGISLFLVWPQITGFLLQATSCFDSLSKEGDVDEQVSRLRMVPDVICYDSTYNFSLLLIIVCLVMYNIVLPLLVVRSMNKYSLQMYVTSQLSIDEQSIQQTIETNDVKSYFGFFFSGLNLGGQPFRKVSQGSDQKDQDGESNEKQTLGSKCRSCLGKLTQPISGGVEVLITKDSGHADENEYVRSYFHWEFIQFIQKFVMQLAVVFMADMSQALQSILVFILTLFFTTLQVANKDIYYRKELNSLNLQVWAVVSLYNFSKVVIRSTELDQAAESVSELTGVTGVSLGDDFKEITRSNAFAGGES